MRPSDVDNIEPTEGEPPGWHVRETKDGYPLMGSSPAERADQRERMARIKANAMRDHPFVGDGPYCDARISFAPMGGPDTGVLTEWIGCGYPPDTHPVPELTVESQEESEMSESGRAALAITSVDRAVAEGRTWLKANRHTGHKDRAPEWFEALASAVEELVEVAPISRTEAQVFYGEA